MHYVSCTRFVVVTVVLLSLAVQSFAAKAAKPQGMLPLEAPLAWDGEFVDISHSETLLTRYASKNFADDLAFYLRRARQAARGRTPGVIHIREVFVKHIDVVMHPNGQTIHYACNLKPSVIAEAPAYEKLYADSMFAASNGALRIEFSKPLEIDDTVVYDHDDERNQTEHWWFAPYEARDELKPYFKNIKPGGDDFLFFCEAPAYRDGGKQRLNLQFGGVAYADEEVNGSRLVTLNDHELARGTHEMGHQLYDTTVPETEGMTVTRFHGMEDAGYFGDELWDENAKIGPLTLGPVMSYYRDCMRYYVTREMWQRWGLHVPHHVAHEPFASKAYVWDDVKADYWFKLPQLTQDALRTLTGLHSLSIDSGLAYIVLNVDPSEPVLSPVLSQAVENDCSLNNAINLKTESAAVLKTATGTWLFVKPQLADLYVNMLQIRGEPAAPLPVYGYLLEDEKGLIALKLPDRFDLPANELGFFAKPTVDIRADGLSQPGSNVFHRPMSLILTPKMPGTIRYTLNDTAPTATSPASTGPLRLDDSAVIRAGLFDARNQRVGRSERSEYVYQPLLVTVTGLSSSRPPLEFKASADVSFASAVPNATICYTLDGFEPTAESPVYERPLHMVKDTFVNARIFDASGRPVGKKWSASYFNYGFQANLATDKPVTASGHEGNHVPENAVDGTIRLEKGWYASPVPQWLTVDLLQPTRLNRAQVFTYWDGARYYQYRIETSVDGTHWEVAVDMSHNTTVSTPQGVSLPFEQRVARYVKITMLNNSANAGSHLIQLRLF